MSRRFRIVLTGEETLGQDRGLVSDGLGWDATRLRIGSGGVAGYTE